MHRHLPKLTVTHFYDDEIIGPLRTASPAALIQQQHHGLGSPALRQRGLGGRLSESSIYGVGGGAGGRQVFREEIYGTGNSRQHLRDDFLEFGQCFEYGKMTH